MNNTLSHLDEYKMLRDEITSYQNEMQRTWLWAFTAMGAIYPWLALDSAPIKDKIPDFIWFIPPLIIFFCLLRYWVFHRRIEWVKKYLYKIEAKAFKDDTDLPGIGHYEELSPLLGHVCGVFFSWILLLVVSIVLSTILLTIEPDTSSSGTSGNGTNASDANNNSGLKVHQCSQDTSDIDQS